MNGTVLNAGLTEAQPAAFDQAAVTLFALLIFGFIKGKATVANALVSSMQTVTIGGLAAGHCSYYYKHGNGHHIYGQEGYDGQGYGYAYIHHPHL